MSPGNVQYVNNIFTYNYQTVFNRVNENNPLHEQNLRKM